MSTEFGKRLKAARKHAKLTQKELAPLTGMSQSNLSDLENTAHGSSFTVQIAEACDVNPHWLATGEGEMLDQPTALGYSGVPRVEHPKAPSFSMADLVDLLSGMLVGMDEDSRKRTRDALQTLAAAPDSAIAQRRLIDLLNESPAPAAIPPAKLTGT